MEPKRVQPMNISVSWTQPWPTQQSWVERMDDTQLEILVQDMMFDEDDTALACEMLNRIGIRT